MNTDLAQRGAVLLSKVVAARMVLLFASGVAALWRGCTCAGAKPMVPGAFVAAWSGAGRVL